MSKCDSVYIYNSRWYMNIQLVNIDKDPKLDHIVHEQNHVFAGTIKQVQGVNYTEPGDTEKDKRIFYQSKEQIVLALESGDLKTIWVNHNYDLKEFSVKISGTENMRFFIEKYGDFFGRGNYFLVCDDIRHIYESNTGTEKTFYVIDSVAQLDNDFNLWRN